MKTFTTSFNVFSAALLSIGFLLAPVSTLYAADAFVTSTPESIERVETDRSAASTTEPGIDSEPILAKEISEPEPELPSMPEALEPTVEQVVTEETGVSVKPEIVEELPEVFVRTKIEPVAMTRPAGIAKRMPANIAPPSVPYTAPIVPPAMRPGVLEEVMATTTLEIATTTEIGIPTEATTTEPTVPEETELPIEDTPLPVDEPETGTTTEPIIIPSAPEEEPVATSTDDGLDNEPDTAQDSAGIPVNQSEPISRPEEVL